MAEEIVKEFRAHRRAKRLLQGLLEKKQISAEGLKWLEIATDPFHDTEIVCDGYPDMVTTRSIVQTITKTFSITAPADTVWDAHIFFAPISPSFHQGTATTTTTSTAPITSTTGINTSNVEKSEEEDSDDAEVDEVMKKVEKAGGWQKVKKTNWNLFLDLKNEMAEAYKQKAKRLREEGERVGAVTLPGYYRTTINANGQMIQNGAGNYLLSGWNCMTVNTGLDWQSFAATENPNGVFPATNAAGTYRLIATGCEVVNTTAQLYKGGAVTVYRSPCPKTNMTAYTYGSDADTKAFNCGTFPTGIIPPSTQPNASLFPNSKTWGAEDGVYMIGAMNSTENPYTTPAPGLSGLLTPTSATSMLSGSGWVGYIPRVFQQNDSQTNASLSAATTLWPWDITGCIFSGLNVNTTLQVTVRYYVERHPSIAEPDLLVLARTPCPYDPVVQEIYSRAMHGLPVGVPVGMNPLGEWFNEVLDAVATWAPEIGKAVGNIIPGASLIGGAIGTGAKGWLTTRKNTKGGSLPAPKPKNGGTTYQKVKLGKNGKIKEVDTKIVSKKKKYTKAQKAAYQAQQAAKMLSRKRGILTAKRPTGPNRRKAMTPFKHV